METVMSEEKYIGDENYRLDIATGKMNNEF